MSVAMIGRYYESVGSLWEVVEIGAGGTFLLNNVRNAKDKVWATSLGLGQMRRHIPASIAELEAQYELPPAPGLTLVKAHMNDSKE